METESEQAEEIARLRRENDALGEALAQGHRLGQMKALAEAARAIIGSNSLEGTIQAITAAARQVVGAHQSVCSLTRGSDRAQVIAAVDLSEKYAAWRGYDALTDGSGIYAWVSEGNLTVRMTQAEMEAHPRWRGFGVEAGRHPPMRGWLATALVGGDGRNLGLIQLSDKEDGGEFDGADEAIVVQLAQFAASAIERVEAETHVREREEQLRLLADALPLLVSFIGPDQRYLVMNKAHEEWFQRPRAELLGRTIREVLGEEAYAQRQDRIEAALRGEPVRFEAVTPATHGALRDTEVHYLPRLSADGVVDGFYGVVLDLTDQKEAQRALQAAREEAEKEAARTGAILGQLAEGVIVSDEAGRITFVNEAARRIHGTAPLDVRPGDYSRSYGLFTLDGQPYPAQELPLTRAALGGETVEDARWIVRRADGRELVVVGGARPIRTSGGQQVGAVLTMRDDTARAAAEAELRRLNQNLEAEVEVRTAERDRIWMNSNELMAVFGFDGLRRATNPSWTRVLGWDEETLRTTAFTEITHPEDRPRLLAAVARLKAGERLVAFEDRLRHVDGSWRTVSWTGVPGDGVFYAIGRDVTEQRLAEEALRQSQKMEAVGQLTGGIAHDFNNLLAGIVGSLDLMQSRIRQGRTGELGRYIEAAMGSAQRAAALTHRLLAFSRRQALDPKPVEANRLVGGMEDLLRRTLGPGIGLELDLAPGPWRILCDPVQLESALLNLCINARDAMPNGGTLVLRTENVEIDRVAARSLRSVDPGTYVAISVSDTGIGMPSEIVERVFEPFFTTKPLGQGTGLGLSMVYGFTRQSGGHVRIQSEVRHGTTVWLYLPRHDGRVEVEHIITTPAEPRHAAAGETILVVEDEEVVRSLMIEVLDELGYRTLEAEDGPAGLRLLEEAERIDLLVTDVGLPGLDGRQLAEQGRRLRPGLPVLLVTGYAQGGSLTEVALESGMALLTKPFSVAALATKLREILRRG